MIGALHRSFSTIASDSVITTRVSTMVLSETYARWARPVAHSGYPRGTMVRRVPRRRLQTGQNVLNETHPRTFVSDAMDGWHELPHSTSPSDPSAMSFASSVCQDSRVLL